MSGQDFDAMRKNIATAEAFSLRVNDLNEKLKTVKEIKESVAKGDELIAKSPSFAEAVSGTHNIVKEELKKLEEALDRQPDGLISKINGYRSLLMTTGSLSQQEEKNYADAGAALLQANTSIDEFINGPWAKYIEALKLVTLTGDQVIIK
jgi:hypothetical protein